MTAPEIQPPRAAEWLLERLVGNRTARLGLAGDLHEGFIERRRTGGRWRSGCWYWLQVVTAGVRYVVERFRPRRSLLTTPRRGDRTRSLVMHLVQDLRYAARMLRRTPGTAFVAVLTLTLGIGLPTTMFAIVNGVLEDLPVERPRRLMQVSRTDPARGGRFVGATHHDFADWRAQLETFEGVGAFTTDDVTLSGGDVRPLRRDAAFVSDNLFEVLGVQPTLGRAFRPDDAGPAASPVVMVSHAVWHTRFGGATDVLGRTLAIDGTPHTVVGVMPERFGFPGGEGLWIPIALSLDVPRAESPDVQVFGRLAEGVSIEQARAEVRTIAARWADAYPDTYGALSADIGPLRGGEGGAVLARGLYTMLGAVSFVLLIACANVANLLLARVVHRSQEIAVRTALGAGRRRVITQFLVEAFVITALGGVFGTALAWGGARIANGALGSFVGIPWIEIGIDGTVLLFVIVVVAVGSLLAGVLPAVQASHAAVSDALKDDARGVSGVRLGRFSRALVIGEIALSCALLVFSGLMIKGVLALRGVDLGMPVEEIVTGEVELPREVYQTLESRVAFFEEFEARLAAIPGVRAAALMSDVPGTIGFALPTSVEGGVMDDGPAPRVAGLVVTPAFLDVLDAPIVEGRGFTAQDRRGSERVALVNRRFADEFTPSRSPVGRTLHWGNVSATIVGVVPDLFMGSLDRPNANGPGLYLPLAQSGNVSMQLMVRAAGDPLAATSQIRDALEAIDANLALTAVDRADRVIAADTAIFDIFGRLFLVFGLGALFLASIGLYGVMAFTVGQRAREWGVRMALGARSGDVLRIVMQRAFVHVGIGLAIGLVIAGIVSTPLSNFFYLVEPWDGTIFTIIAIVLAGTGLAATYVPARRATRVDPVEAFR